MKLSILNLLVLSIGLSACTTISRHSGSGYSGSRFEDEDKISLDSESTRALSPAEREALEDKMMVSRLEGGLRTSEEKSQYNSYKSSLESDRERIEFLSLDGARARERYLQSKGYSSSPARHGRDIASLIEQNDIAVGMPKEAVRESWGDPESVEVAGRRDSGNERWKYTEYVTTPEGYQQEQRLLYFENGRLVGWEKY